MIAPLAQDALAALSDLRGAFPSQPIALVGAAALGCHLSMRWRRTEDIDLVIAISVEDASRVLGSLPGWKQNARKEHEWTSPRGALVDILPVSKEAMDRRVLVWPRTGYQMSLVGIRHALSAASLVLSPGIALAVPSVPVIALLKMVSYLDRPAERERDLIDLAYVFNDYPPPDDDRLYADEIYERGLQLETAGPFVLGRDLAAIVDAVERATTLQFLERVGERDLHRFIALGPWSTFEPERVEARLKALRDGLT
ncbi:MAG: nucleotidyl transferase AbiEii/AbiGii toxin family protein [Deltaproteobacteria bacterium]|nr:nucleotidyl transferase AbiEii/AbiGii toxin family protein [Deltaproteobacteria bacterium]